MLQFTDMYDCFLFQSFASPFKSSKKSKSKSERTESRNWDDSSPESSPKSSKRISTVKTRTTRTATQSISSSRTQAQSTKASRTETKMVGRRGGGGGSKSMYQSRTVVRSRSASGLYTTILLGVYFRRALKKSNQRDQSRCNIFQGNQIKMATGGLMIFVDKLEPKYSQLY